MFIFGFTEMTYISKISFIFELYYEFLRVQIFVIYFKIVVQ